MLDKFDKGDLIGLSKIGAILLFLFLVFGARFLAQKEDWYVETIATIYPCTYKNAVLTYESDYHTHDDIYICGKTNKSSQKFELRIYEQPHETIIYLDDITIAESKAIQHHVDYEFPPGTYLVRLTDPRKIIASTTFSITQDKP